MTKIIDQQKVLADLRKELKENIDEKTKASFGRFFKEKVNCYGIKTGVVVKIAQKKWKELKEANKEEIFGLAEELLKSGTTEEAFVVSSWLPQMVAHFNEKDFEVFKKWIENYIDNWAKCDSFCNHTMGDFIQMYPEYIKELINWTESKNRWVKRAAAVSLIVPAKKGKYLSEALEISERLLIDPDDMVQKGYGWLLKEESRVHQKEIFDYVVKNKKVMPRTALRYAIELMPKELRQRAMEKANG